MVWGRRAARSSQHFPEILPVSFSLAPPTPHHIGAGCLHHGTLPQASSLKSVCCPLLARADSAPSVGVSWSPGTHHPQRVLSTGDMSPSSSGTLIRNNDDTRSRKGRPWSDIPGHKDITSFLCAVLCGSNLAPRLSLAAGITQSVNILEHQ